MTHKPKATFPKWLFIPIVAFVALMVLLALGLRQDPSELPSALAGKPLPAFTANDLSGQTHQSSSFEGPALLNVWATWCPTCKVEHAYLNTLAAEGVTIYGLNYKDDDQKAREWLEKYDSPYALNLVDNSGQIGMDLGVVGAPETFLINESGEIVLRHAGEMNAAVWEQKFADHYAQMMNAGEGV